MSKNRYIDFDFSINVDEIPNFYCSNLKELQIVALSQGDLLKGSIDAVAFIEESIDGVTKRSQDTTVLRKW
jgi:hypothetical protein